MGERQYVQTLELDQNCALTCTAVEINRKNVLFLLPLDLSSWAVFHPLHFSIKSWLWNLIIFIHVFSKSFSIPSLVFLSERALHTKPLSTPNSLIQQSRRTGLMLAWDGTSLPLVPEPSKAFAWSVGLLKHCISYTHCTCLLLGHQLLLNSKGQVCNALYFCNWHQKTKGTEWRELLLHNSSVDFLI